MDTKIPLIAVASGDRRRSGSVRIPALIADVSLTVWNLCGMLIRAAIKGNPVKNPFLDRKPN